MRILLTLFALLFATSVAAERVRDLATVQGVRKLLAKGAMPPLVLVVDDCRAEHERMRANGVEFTQPPEARYGSVDASFRDPSGNGWKMIQSRGNGA